MIKQLLVLCLALASTSGHAGEVVRASVDHTGKRYIMAIEMLISADVDRVNNLLTDYSNLTRLNEAIKESYIVYSLDDTTHRVFVRIESCITFFCKSITQVQDVEELAGNVIVGKVVPEKSDFDYAHSRWKISQAGDRTKISFNTDFRPSFWVPPLIGPLLIERKLRSEALITIEGLEKLAGEQQP